MLQLRRSSDRGHTQLDWLDSRHTFSFGDYYDPAYVGFGALRVINEDRVAPGAGFPTHAHQNMEIVSYVLEGELEHRDSLGNGSIIRPGDIQRMSAGTGVRHSEYNASKTQPVHFLQIWLLPARPSLPPSYEQKHFDVASLRDRWTLVGSSDGRDGSVVIHQDVSLFATQLDDNQTVRYSVASGRRAYLHVARGTVRLNDQTLAAGDGAAFTEARDIVLVASGAAEALLFDLR